MCTQNFSLLIHSNKFLLAIILLFTISTHIYPQTTTKKGGICFRTDDDQPLSKYLEYAALFNKYNKKFTFALNLGKNEITADYINEIKQMQTSGHEMMDHTPWHDTHWFQTFLSTDIYIDHPGVHRVTGPRIDLNHADVNINDAKRTGFVNISTDTVTSTSGIFSSFSKSDCYLYFPSIDKLVFIDDKTGWINQNTVIVTDFWGDSINLNSHQNIQFYNFDIDNIHLTIDAIKALLEESLRLANYYGIMRPYAWIQPGGYFPHVYANEIKQAAGDAFGYKAGGLYNDASLKVFNEYNPNNDEQFGLNWGDFNEDIWTLEDCKGFIADRIAKHHVVIGHSHFEGGELLGGWSGFLSRTEALLQWCTANDIPIKTYSEWTDVLYNQIPNPNENIFPPLNVDLDANHVPDGYNQSGEGTLSTSDGYPNDNAYCYTIRKVGDICSISNLGGIEKGQNQFEIYTKGRSGDYIEVSFKVGAQNIVYKFRAQSSGWTKYNLSQSVNGNTALLNIPDNISLIDVTIRCSSYNYGTVKISGMNLYKSSSGGKYLTVDPTYVNVPSLLGSTTFDIYSNLSWSISDNASWLTVSPTSGSNNRTITANYTENTTSSQREGTITISGNGLIRTVTITQAAANKLEVTPSNQSVANTAGSTTFTITANVNWTGSDNADWLTLSDSSGSNDKIITATYSKNETISQRIASITITGGGITRTVTVTQAAGTYSQDCPAYMISYWKLDETAGNLFIDNYNGYNGHSGTSSPTPTTGIVGGGQSFNGTNNEINISSTPEFNFGVSSSFSIELWIRHPGSISQNEVIIGRDDAGSNLQWWVGINNSGKAAFNLESKTGEGFSTTGTSTLTNSAWHHIVAVRNANLNEIRLYVDGVLEDTTPAIYNSGFDSPTSNINIGWLNITGGYHFAGSIDEVAIYDDALSLTEIQNHHYAGLSGVGYCDPQNTIAVKLFLEGPYFTVGDSMSTALKTNNFVPFTSPYSQNPRIVSAVPQNVVDWILFELRSSVSGSAVISKSVFLDKRGNLVADDGITQNILFSVAPGNYYIVIKHRNHLAIMSSIALGFDRGLLTTYDFTTGAGQFYGTGGAKELKPGVWGMWAGDANGDGQVNAADRNETWNFRNQVGYRIQDVTLDAQTNAADRNMTWNNRNHISLVP